jgi:hypothetical protein
MTDHGDVLMAEYTALKAEQLARIGTRDNLLYATLAAIGGILAAALTARQPACLLLVPPACVILGWTYLVNDLKISAIREYVAADLAPQVAALAGGPAFGWEYAHLADPLYAARRAGHLAVDLLAFAAAPAAAIAVCLAVYSGPVLAVAAMFAVAAAETAGIAVMARQITRCYIRFPVSAGGAS